MFMWSKCRKKKKEPEKIDCRKNGHKKKPEKRRVLMLASVASMIDQFNMSNIRLLADMGYEVHVACNFNKGNTCDAAHIREFRHRLGRVGVICHQWDCPRNVWAAGKCLAALIQLRRLTGKYRFCMIHCHSPIGSVLARVTAHFRGIFVVYTAHGFHFYKGAPVKNWLLYYPVEKLLSGWTDVLVTVNREDYRFARRHFKTGKIYRIPGVGVDTGRFAGKDADVCREFRKQYGIAQDAVLLLSVGELNQGKNHRMLLEAAALAEQKYRNKNIYCLVCGMGKLQGRLLRQAEKLDIADRVRFPGYVEEIADACAAADLFVFPSKREGMPVALMEAMAAGLPVIASDIRGNADLVDKKGGRLLKYWDKEGFAAAIAELAEWKERRPKQLEAMGRYNRNKIRSCDISCVNARMRRIYGDIRGMPGRKDLDMHGETDASGKILTIIVPMYQSEAFIEKCLDSMMLDAADMRRLEILVVNDGSRDSSAALAERYVRRWPDTVRLLNKENGGHGSAVNLGAAECRGRFLKVVDADDRVSRKGLKKILNILQDTEAGRADAVLAGYRITDIRNGRTQTVSCGQAAGNAWTDHDSVLRDWGRYSRLFTLHGLIYRTDFYRAAGGFLPEHVSYDDAYYDVVYAARASGIYVTDVILYEYRIGNVGQSVSAENRERRLGQLETVLLKICETAQDAGRLSEAGAGYWYRRTASFMADYYATAFLRAADRRKGRAAARAFSRKIKKKNRRLHNMCRMKYAVLLAMHLLHLDERHLEAAFRIREMVRTILQRKRFRMDFGV